MNSAIQVLSYMDTSAHSNTKTMRTATRSFQTSTKQLTEPHNRLASRDDLHNAKRHVLAKGIWPPE